MMHPPSRNPQRELHALLQVELLHTLGAYGLVTSKLKELEKVRRSRGGKKTGTKHWDRVLTDTLRTDRKFNKGLQEKAHKPAHLRLNELSELLKQSRVPPRHPAPKKAPWSPE